MVSHTFSTFLAELLLDTGFIKLFKPLENLDNNDNPTRSHIGLRFKKLVSMTKEDVLQELKVSAEKVKVFAEGIEYDLLSKPKKGFLLKGDWNQYFPDSAGVYAVFENKKFIYIGETANIRARMKDIRRTYNHTLRNKLGKIRLKAIREGNKFSDEIEAQLDTYMVDNIEVTCHSLTFGRKEVEAYIIEKRKATLLNSVSLRGK